MQLVPVEIKGYRTVSDTDPLKTRTIADVLIQGAQLPISARLDDLYCGVNGVQLDLDAHLERLSCPQR